MVGQLDTCLDVTLMSFVNIQTFLKHMRLTLSFAHHDINKNLKEISTWAKETKDAVECDDFSVI